MSIPEGKAEFNKRLKLALNKSPAYKALQKNYRDKLNYKYIHILDISRSALARNADTPDKLERFDSSYDLFLNTIENTSIGITKYSTISELKIANPDRITKGVIYVRDPAILICPSFGSARSFITYKISKSIPRDEFFGITNRARSLEELIEEGYDINPINPNDPSEGWKIKSGKKVKIRYFDSEGYELVDKGSAERLSRELSNLDIGHLYTKGEKTRQAPLSFKLEQLLKIPAVSPSIKQLVDNALTDLSNLEANVGFSFISNLPKGLTKGGYLTLTLEFYTLNGLKAIQETAIYNQVRDEIINEIKKGLPTIPGSNTMSQDAAEIVRQALVSAIKGTKSIIKLQPHGLISGSVKDKSKIQKTNSSSVTITSGSKQKKSTKKVSNNLPPPTTSLTSLQSLINQHLQNIISANMGDGSSKRTLNYRTGRFAESAKVESMSQSRQGMITAFYSYMKNPYQTFEPGFKQGSPKTRDPKLLISQSIREIAATRVGNQLRAVSL
jgi:hypothetical protein